MHTPNRNREIVAIDIECDVHVLRVQVGSGRIMEAPDLAVWEDQATDGVCIARSTFQTVPKMHRT